MNALQILKLWFLGRLLREKLLVLVLVVSGAVIWLSSASTRLRVTTGAFRVANANLETQAVWLGSRGDIEEAAKLAVSHLDPTKTYDATYLVSKVVGMAKNAGLNPNTAAPRTERSPQFAMHTVQMSAPPAEMASVLRFYQALAEQAPYLGLSKLSLYGDKGTPGMVRATIEIKSVELLREATAPIPVVAVKGKK